MRRVVFGLILLVCLASPAPVAGQAGEGSLRGIVQDAQGAAVPGVTITATSPALITPSVTVSESDGSYRIVNLPPGTYALEAELPGFSTFRREGLLLRAGANFQVDIMMALGALEETITVTGDSPMLEVSRPSNVLNIDAEFQKEVPVVEGKYWSDFLMMTPGVISRPHNDGSGRQNYFGNAVEHRDAVTLMEGLYAGNYNDFNINRVGAELAKPSRTPRSRPAASTRRRRWATGSSSTWSARAAATSSGGIGRGTVSANRLEREQRRPGTPATRQVHQYDFSPGGPVRRDRDLVLRRLPLHREQERHRPFAGAASPSTSALFPDGELGEQHAQRLPALGQGHQKVGDNHDALGRVPGRPLLLNVVGAEDYEPVEVLSTGGPMYGAKLTSVWGQSAHTTFSGELQLQGRQLARQLRGT